MAMGKPSMADDRLTRGAFVGASAAGATAWSLARAQMLDPQLAFAIKNKFLVGRAGVQLHLNLLAR